MDALNNINILYISNCNEELIDNLNNLYYLANKSFIDNYKIISKQKNLFILKVFNTSIKTNNKKLDFNLFLLFKFSIINNYNYIIFQT